MGKISEAKKQANKKWNDKNKVRRLHLNTFKKACNINDYKLFYYFRTAKKTALIIR